MYRFYIWIALLFLSLTLCIFASFKEILQCILFLICLMHFLTKLHLLTWLWRLFSMNRTRRQNILYRGCVSVCVLKFWENRNFNQLFLSFANENFENKSTLRNPKKVNSCRNYLVINFFVWELQIHLDWLVHRWCEFK